MTRETDTTSDAARTGDDADQNREKLAQHAGANLHAAARELQTEESRPDDEGIEEMHAMKQFSLSSNGDRWFLTKNKLNGEAVVLHRANAPAGGHETVTSVADFLSVRPLGPEREALLAILEAGNGSGA